MKKTRPTEDEEAQLAALDAIRDADIDLSDIPGQGNKSGWVRGSAPSPASEGKGNFVVDASGVLLDLAASADAGEGIRQGLEDAKRGDVMPVRQFFARFEGAHGIAE
jgi:hypothetical protein